MKPKHVFWGLFLVTLGTLILISNFSIINLDLSGLWKLWPVALILWGISFIINKDFIKVVFAGVIAIVLALTIYGAGQSILNICDKDLDFEFANGDNHYYADTTRYVESFDKKIKNADLKIDAGAGAFSITESTTDLIAVTALGIKDNYIFKRIDSGNSSSIDLKMKKTKIKLQKGSFKNKMEISLNQEPVWNMDFDLGAAAIDFDLSPYKISTARIDIGAASLDLQLGDKYPETIVDLDAGAASVDIIIPDSSGCEIRSDVSLSSKHFNGFDKIESGLYRTNNFETSANKIFIRIDAGVSSIDVRRYSKEW
jgi:hypothetical protein